MGLKENQRKYHQTSMKYKQSIKDYQHTPQRKEYLKKYHQTERYKQNTLKQAKRHREKYREQINIKQRELRKTPYGRYMLYKGGANRRNIEFALSLDEFKKLWQKPCHYCGDSIETIGIDRIDNTKGYIDGNIITCCSVCNKMKLDYTEAFWIGHIKKILKKGGDTNV